MFRSFSLTLKVCALLVLVAAGALLSGPAGFGPEPQSAEAAALNEIKKLLASDRQPLDHFGWSVAVSGDTAVVGAIREDAGGVGVGAGAAYVFQRDQGGADNWGEVKKLTASDAGAGDHFGRSVALSGDTAVVGAIWEDAGGSSAGAAYVFQRNEGGADNWGEMKKLTASDAQAGDQFGGSVAVSGDTAVVGAFNEDAGGTDAGAAYVFQRNEGGADNWGEMKKLIASDAQTNDNFGRSVAVSGDTAVVGAIREDAGGVGAGAAYVFQRDEGGADNWGELKKLTASDAQANDFFGRSVAVSGDTAVVGAYNTLNGMTSAVGAAYVFRRDLGGPGNWGEVKKLTPSDADSIGVGPDPGVMNFGQSVAVSGDITVIGASRFIAGGTASDPTYLFQRNQGGADNWGELMKLTASDANAMHVFGRSVAVSGDTAVVGASGEYAGGPHDNSGAAYVFDLLQPKATPTPVPPPTPTDTDGDGVPDDFEGGFGGTNIKITNPESDPPNSATVTGDAASGSTITSGELVIELPPGTLATSPTTEIEIIFVADGPAPGVNPKIEISGVVLPDGTTKTVEMPFGDQNAVCIDDRPVAEIETIDVGFCTAPRVEIEIPADGGTTTSGVYSVSRTGSTIRIEGLTHTAIGTIMAAPPPVGGISLDSGAGLQPLDTASSERGLRAFAWAIAAAAGVAALGGAAWYARRRWAR